MRYTHAIIAIESINVRGKNKHSKHWALRAHLGLLDTFFQARNKVNDDRKKRKKRKKEAEKRAAQQGIEKRRKIGARRSRRLLHYIYVEHRSSDENE